MKKEKQIKPINIEQLWDRDDIRYCIRDGRSKGQYYTHFYPTDKIKKAKFQSSQQISEYLLKEGVEMGYCKWQLFQKQTIDKGDLYKIIYSCRMKQCQATLVYYQKKQNEDIATAASENGRASFTRRYYLAESKIVNRHNHILYLSKTIAKDIRIKQYLQDLPAEQKFEQHVQAIKQKFNLSKCQAKCLRDRIFWKFRDEDHMLKKFTERKIEFRRKQQNNKTLILLIITPSMKKCFQKFGDILCFDITYKLIKKKVGQEKHAGVGFFVGHDGNSRIVLYGVSTIQKQNNENFQILFQYFFQMVGNIPETILTDDQKAIGLALQNLKKQKKYTYVHLLDWYHKMQALKRTLKREGHCDELFRLFARAIKEPSKQVYFDIASQIAMFLRKKQTMIDFVNGHNQYSLSQAPPKFFAFGISSTRAQSFNNLIKRSVPHQTNFGRFMFFVLRVETRLLNRMSVLNFMHKQLTNRIHDPQIIMLSQHLQTLALEQMRQYYEQGRQFPQVVQGNTCLERKVKYKKYERPYHFNLFYDIKYNCWRCQCQNNFRTGMPCSHQVRVIRQNGGCLSYYINQRWYHDKQQATAKKASRPPLKHKKI